ENDMNFDNITEVVETIINSLNKGGKVIICGNGGSMTDAMHFAEEFTGRFRKDRKALPAISLSDPSHITCVANDYGFENIFSRGVEAYGRSGDVFIGLSTSGNSKNIIEAVKVAKELKLKIVLLLGKGGGELKGMGDIEIIINGKTSDRIQEIHMLILHTIVEGVERLLFPENYI
ncbi:MAG: D-sedoheptulose 7-phosphate isomerase, partial [Candidatus Delongbacteria bacterium]|nr:D-sedoheptulose 7-phosphate isomerase [Candidatus Delongbacteria bacterium]